MPGQPAEVGNRFVAKLVDGLLIGLVLVPLFLLGAPGDDRAVTVATGLAGFVYFVVLDARGGTVGKRLLRLSVVDAAGRAPGLGPSSVRNLWLLTSLLPTVFGQLLAVLASVGIAVTIARDPRSVGIHDRYAATFVRSSA
ncbi:RDD family protein [Egicoccus sp. AB-alg2]|uniref:RDD family protein n=1 Tax=Egicoccus sp. AB-alg2 TaxID=3242693 RepID=UPI00359D1DCB